MDLSGITASFNGLTDLQKKAFETSIKEADNGDGILDIKEFTEATKKFSATDAFKGLSAENQVLFTQNLNPNAIWAQQGATSVVNFDGMQKQTEYYEELLNDPTRNKGADGKPLVTKDQLDFARERGFGDLDGTGIDGNRIDGNELAVLDLNSDGNRDFNDGDLNGDGKVDGSDRGIGLGSSEASSNGGFNSETFLALIQQLIQIWLPQQGAATTS